MGLALSLIDEDASAAGFAGATTAATMMAIVHRRYGRPDVLEYTEVDKPVVGDDDVLVRVHAAAVHPGDYFVMTGVPYVVRLAFGLRRPRNGIRGMDLAGRVEAVGRTCRDWSRVMRCSAGAPPERWPSTPAPQRTISCPKPANLTVEQAAAMPMSALTALQALRDIANVQPGQTVLVTGASGGVGTFAVQIAKAFGAEVTGVCSTRNVDLVRSLGADHVIDYTRTDFTRTETALRRHPRQRGSAVAGGCPPRADAHRHPHPQQRTRRPLARPPGPDRQSARAVAGSPASTLKPFLSVEKRQDLLTLADLLEAGQVTPVIDRTYPLDEAADALRYVGAGHTRGKVVVTV